jgi:predicted glycoside hydrolase/deacetylase ChbG (UPF0249 family)
LTARLVVNADDVGLTKGINEAALRGHVNGVVTSVSLLAVGRAFDHAVAVLRDHPDLSVGAHFAVVGEDPPLLSPAEIPTLVDRHGQFPLGYRTFVLRAAAGKVDPGDVRREVGAQLERIRSAGLQVSHLDTHQHTHLWPLVGRVVARLADETGIPWVRLPTSRAPGPVGVVVRRLSNRLARTLDGFDLSYPDAYAGLDEAGRMDRERFARAVAAVAADGPAGGVAEVNVHPGEPDDPDLDRFVWDYHWKDELSMLTDPDTTDLVRRHGLALTSFGELAGGTS